MSLFEPEFIASLQARLDKHPIYAAVETVDDLRVFMAHHVHSVWDFMSLIKYLQYTVAPARWPWTPGADPTIQRFINELVLEEETDEAGPGAPGEFSSHFQLYLGAMREIGVDADKPARFVEIAGRHDPCIVPRAVPVLEAMVALVLADRLLAQRALRA